MIEREKQRGQRMNQKRKKEKNVIKRLHWNQLRIVNDIVNEMLSSDTYATHTHTRFDIHSKSSSKTTAQIKCIQLHCLIKYESRFMDLLWLLHICR